MWVNFYDWLEKKRWTLTWRGAPKEQLFRGAGYAYGVEKPFWCVDKREGRV